MAGVFRFPYQRDSLEPNRKDLALWMDRDRAIEDWISDPSFDLFVTVASDGTGDYDSIKDAIEGVDINTSGTGSTNVTIFVKSSATDYDDSGRGRVSLRNGLRVTVTAGLQPAGRTSGFYGSLHGQQRWTFDGFTVASSGTSFLGISNMLMVGPSATWFSGSGANTAVWFENCYFDGNGTASGGQLCQTAGSSGALRMVLTNCGSEDFVVVAPGNVCPALIMDDCLMLVGLTTTTSALSNTAGWIINNSSTAQMPTVSGSGGTYLSMTNTFVGGTFTYNGNFNLRTTGCLFETMSLTMDSNTGEDAYLYISNCKIGFLSTSSGGSATNNDDRFGVITGCIVDGGTFGADDQALDSHGFLVDMVFTGTALTISGDSQFFNVFFAADSAVTVTLSGDNNTLIYGNKSAVTVNDTGTGNRVNTFPPSGPAGGVLSGTYPDPGFAVDMATQAELDAAVALLIPKSVIDAKGDLIAGSADDTVVRVPVGTDGQVLQADSGATGGISWTEFATDSSLNLLYNNQASLETDTTGWAVYQDCTIAVSAAQASHGNNSLEMTHT